MAVFGAQTISAGPATPTTPANVSSLFDLLGQSSQADTQEISFGDIAAGDLQEAGAYGTAAGIATANSRLALIGGDIEQAQEGIKLGQTIGSQRAAVSAGGFANSGTALNLLRSSTQQGHIQQQITGVNAELQSGGFQEQAAAAGAEGSAASAAAASQTALAAGAKALSVATKTMATNTAASMGITVPGMSKLSGTNIPVPTMPGTNTNNGLPYVSNTGLVVPNAPNTTPAPVMPTVGPNGLIVPPAS
jgi:hypothetical protein